MHFQLEGGHHDGYNINAHNREHLASSDRALSGSSLLCVETPLLIFLPLGLCLTVTASRGGKGERSAG